MYIVKAPVVIDVFGFISSPERFRRGHVVIRCTSDSQGETLSLSDDKTMLFQVKVKDIEEAIRRARNDK